MKKQPISQPTACFHEDMIGFMLDIRLNNNKAFMAEHKDEYIQRMRDPYYCFIEALAPLMLAIDPQMEVRPYKALSRIYRDTRFSHDKSPYRDHHWIAFRRAGEPREGSVVFWFEIRVEEASWGLGFWGENKNALDILRRRILAHPQDILEHLPKLKKRGLVLGGRLMRRVQPPPELHPQLEDWYLHREIYLQKGTIKPGLIFSPQLLGEIQKDFQALAPFYRLLRGCYDLSAAAGSPQEYLEETPQQTMDEKPVRKRKTGKGST